MDLYAARKEQKVLPVQRPFTGPFIITIYNLHKHIKLCNCLVWGMNGSYLCIQFFKDQRINASKSQYLLLRMGHKSFQVCKRYKRNWNRKLNQQSITMVQARNNKDFNQEINTEISRGRNNRTYVPHKIEKSSKNTTFLERMVLTSRPNEFTIEENKQRSMRANCVYVWEEVRKPEKEKENQLTIMSEMKS